MEKRERNKKGSIFSVKNKRRELSNMGTEHFPLDKILLTTSCNLKWDVSSHVISFYPIIQKRDSDRAKSAVNKRLPVGLNEGTQVDGTVRDQNDDALTIQVHTVVDMSSGHLGSGTLTGTCVESHAHRKLLIEGKSQSLVLGHKTEKELPSVLGADLQLHSNFLTSRIDKGRLFKSDNRVKWHETEMDLLGDTPDGLEMHTHGTQGEDRDHMKEERGVKRERREKKSLFSVRIKEAGSEGASQSFEKNFPPRF